jgi:drug/metabolite transporter (DMT)-like permease
MQLHDIHPIGVLFALLTTLSWALGIFPFTQAARRLGIGPLNLFRLALATILIGLIALVLPSSFAALFSRDYLSAWWWLGLSGIIGLTVGDYFGFAMYVVLGARLGSVLTTFAPAAALVTGMLMVDERMTWAGLTGMVITIAGVIWISLSKSEREHASDTRFGSITKGIVFGVLAAFCQGAGLVLAKKGMLQQDAAGLPLYPIHATFIRLSVGTLSLLGVVLVRHKWNETVFPVLINREGGIRYAILGTIFGPTLGVSLALFTVSYLDAAVAQTIFSLVPVVALFLSYFLLRERITGRSLVGVFVAVAGVVILIWHHQLEDLIVRMF